MEPKPTTRSLFQVTAKWLLDLEQFNEWMTEEDYMVDDEFDVSVTVKSVALALLDCVLVGLLKVLDCSVFFHFLFLLLLLLHSP